MPPSAKVLCTSLLVPVCVASPALAQTPASETPVTTPRGRAADLGIAPRIGAGFTTGGVSAPESFFNVEGFVPLSQHSGDRLTFAEGRLLVLTDSTLGGNILLGQRFYNASRDHILGGYLAYDIRDTGNHVFHQLGAGFERLGKWDLRVNAYLPLGDRRRQSGEGFANPRFQQNFLVLDRRRQFEAAIAGFDAEVGGRLLKFGSGDLRGYAGLYYYNAGEQDALGVRGRLEARPNDSLTVGLTVQHDALFDTRVALSLNATFPGSKPRGAPRSTTIARMAESVQRTALILVDQQTKNETVAATNPKTGRPWQFRHVTPGQGSGIGTFEAPADTIQTALNIAQPEDIVYVQFSDRADIPAFAIPDRVAVLSTGPIQRINTVQFGELALPLSGSGLFPRVTGTVTMGNDTTLSGFAIAGVQGNAIQAAGVQSVTIRDNQITSPTAQGISLTDISGTSTIANNTIQASGQQGISASTSGTTQQQLTLDNNTIQDSRQQGLFLQSSESSQQQVIARRTTISNSAAQGVFAQANGNSQQQLAIADSTIAATRRDNTGDGGQGLFAAANSGAQQTVGLSNTQVRDSAAQGVFLQSNGDLQNPTVQTRQTVSASNTTVQTSAGQGLFLQANGNTQQQVAIADSTIEATTADLQGNGGQGLFITANNGANQTVNLNNTQVRNNTAQGVFVQGNGDPLNPGTQTQQAIAGRAVTISNNTLAGMFVQANGNVKQGVTLTDSTIQATKRDAGGNGGQGLFVAAGSGAQQTLDLSTVTLSDNANQGLFIQGNGDLLNPAIQTLQTAAIDRVTVNRNTGTGIFVQANGNVQQRTTITNSTISNTQLDNGNGGQGIFVQANGNAQSLVSLLNNSITNNAGSGVFLQFNGDSQAIATVEFNLLQSNAIPDFFAALNSTQRACLTLNQNAGNNGFLLQRNNGTFQVRDRDTLDSRNTGSVTFQPAIASFENVITCF